MSERKGSEGPGAEGNVVPLRAADVKKVVDPALVYFPDGLKRHYMDLLLRYKNQLAKETGKRVGWQAIRDLVMAEEDAKEAVKSLRSGVGVKVDRPRSADVTLDDIKGWYGREKSHLPTNVKFQYIDRFIRGLRIEGCLDEIESVVSEAQREYFRESVAQFYRPDQAYVPDYSKEFSSEALLPIADKVGGVLDGACFVGCCIFDRQSATSAIGIRQGYDRFAVILFCGRYRQCTVPVSVIACLLPDEAWSRDAVTKGPFSSRGWGVLSGLAMDQVRSMHMFSGFFVPELARERGVLDGRGVIGRLVTRKVHEGGYWVEGVWRGTGRYYCPRVAFGVDDVSVLVWPDLENDLLLRLGLQPVIDVDRPGASRLTKSGLVKVEEGTLLSELRSKFEIGYRPC